MTHGHAWVVHDIEEVGVLEHLVPEAMRQLDHVTGTES